MFYGRKDVPNIYITPVINGVKEKMIIFEGVKECNEEYHQPSGEHELSFVLGVIENIDGYHALTANRYDIYLVSLDNLYHSEEGDDVAIASPKYLFNDLEINAFSSCEGEPVEWQVILRKK